MSQPLEGAPIEDRTQHDRVLVPYTFVAPTVTTGQVGALSVVGHGILLGRGWKWNPHPDRGDAAFFNLYRELLGVGRRSPPRDRHDRTTSPNRRTNARLTRAQSPLVLETALHPPDGCPRGSVPEGATQRPDRVFVRYSANEIAPGRARHGQVFAVAGPSGREACPTPDSLARPARTASMSA